MIPKTAIEKAIEGGWAHGNSKLWLISSRPDGHARHLFGYETVGGNGQFSMCDSEIALDLLFWSALGKALGWAPDMSMHHFNTTSQWEQYKDIETWKYNATRFYDLILTEQPTEPFWNDLLN
jgi:hypothetical protein